MYKTWYLRGQSPFLSNAFNTNIKDPLLNNLMTVCTLIIVCINFPGISLANSSSQAKNTISLGLKHKPVKGEFVKAAYKANIQLIKSLVNRGANLKETTEQGGNALTEALRTNAPDKLKQMIEYLIKVGVPVNARRGGVSHVLNEAIREKQFEIAILLLKKGADLTSIDRNGFSVVDNLNQLSNWNPGNNEQKLKYSQLRKLVYKKLSAGQLKKLRNVRTNTRLRQKAMYIANKNTQRLIPVIPASTVLKIHKPGSIVDSIAVSRNGRTIASSDNRYKHLIVWDFKTKKIVWSRNRGFGNLKSVKFSPNQKQLITGNQDHVARIWNVKNGKLLRKLNGHRSPVLAVNFLPNGKTAITASDDFTMRRWNISSGKTIMLYTGNGGLIRTIDVSANGRWILSYGSDLRLWNVKTGMTEKYYFTKPSNTTVARFSPDSKIIACDYDGGATYIYPNGKTVKFSSGYSIISTKTGELLKSVRAHGARVNDLVFSPKGSLLASASSDGTVQIYDFKNNKIIAILRPNKAPSPYKDGMTSLAFLPDNRHLIAGSDRGLIYVWDLGAIYKGRKGRF